MLYIRSLDLTPYIPATRYPFTNISPLSTPLTTIMNHRIYQKANLFCLFLPLKSYLNTANVLFLDLGAGCIGVFHL